MPSSVLTAQSVATPTRSDSLIAIVVAIVIHIVIAAAVAVAVAVVVVVVVVVVITIVIMAFIVIVIMIVVDRMGVRERNTLHASLAPIWCSESFSTHVSSSL